MFFNKDSFQQLDYGDVKKQKPEKISGQKRTPDHISEQCKKAFDQ